ncbi:MAG: ABC transporter permease [Rhodobacteraceae bacterium]|nr:ABC transporter permease [Paracoccaceae bacterium]MCY4137202.1 ABC transporter permease [Paracoccaceae bacterium]
MTKGHASNGETNPASAGPKSEDHIVMLGTKAAHERHFLARLVGYCRRNPAFPIGLGILGFLVAFAGLGRLLWPVELAQPLSSGPYMPPNAENPFGTDTQGRDVLAVTIAGTWLTMRTGIIAAALGTAIGSALGFASGYFGGWVDNVVNWIVDVLLTVPAILILVVIAASIPGQLSSLSMAFIIALLAWRRPTRQVRSQVLVMRNMGYVDTARLSGMSGFEIILRELVPNLLPYLVAVFVLAVSASILAAVGLQAMGLGPQNEPTLGMTVYWMMYYSAFLQGLWWWIMPPVFVIILLFVGFYLLSTGLDEFANPRLRQDNHR